MAPGGALAGGPGDRFCVSGDLLSSSTQRTAWDTGDGAELEFEGSGSGDGTHRVTLTGADVGPVAAGFEQNFAWGTVAVDAGQRLLLEDGDATPGAALYARTLLLAAAPADDPVALADFIAASLVNVDPARPASVYYDPTTPGDAYLGGRTYALGGGGVLAPAVAGPVPEPAGLAIWGIAAGAMSILWRRCRPRRIHPPGDASDG